MESKKSYFWLNQTYPDVDGNFSTDFFTIPGPDIVQGYIEGIWTIAANTSAESAQTTFSVSTTISDGGGGNNNYDCW
ncbi:MAG: hypothetical protein QMD36_03060 [Candidatus Aenigmarchaeota archaeon]|nr:hypothetical protein [Candidatus Aenigmarchaeota archaeon]